MILICIDVNWILHGVALATIENIMCSYQKIKMYLIKKFKNYVQLQYQYDKLICILKNNA